MQEIQRSEFIQVSNGQESSRTRKNPKSSRAPSLGTHNSVMKSLLKAGTLSPTELNAVTEQR